MIESERLILRRWKASDSEPLAQINADPKVMEYLLNPLSREESDATIARFEKHFDDHGYTRWALELKSTGELIGYTGLFRPSFESHFTPCVEIGWRLAKNFSGHGYASEAARAANADGFKRVGLQEIVSVTVPANRRSIAVMERIGMKRDIRGDFEHPMVPEGNPLRQHVLYRIRNSSE